MTVKYIGRANKAKQLGVCRTRLHQMQAEGKIVPAVMIDNIAGFSEDQQPIKKIKKEHKSPEN
jgi:hypothetical protein